MGLRRRPKRLAALVAIMSASRTRPVLPCDRLFMLPTFEPVPHWLVGDVIANEDFDWFAVAVKEHDEHARQSAAVAILHWPDASLPEFYTRDAERMAEDAIAARLNPSWLREHVSDMPWDDENDDQCGWPCGCEDVGWFCTNGDGPLIPFFKGKREDIELAAQTALLHDEEA